MTSVEIIAAFAASLILFVLLWCLNQVRLERNEMKANKYPQARKSNRANEQERRQQIDFLLSLDDSERFYHN